MKGLVRVIAAAMVVTAILGSASSEAGERLKEVLELKAKKSAEVARLIEEMFIAADPHEIKGANYTVRELLDDFDRDLGTRLNAEPEVEATVREAMGRAYLGLGMPDQAEELKQSQWVRFVLPGPIMT